MNRDIDKILKDALIPENEPEQELNQRILKQIGKESSMRHSMTKKLVTVAAVALLSMVTATSGYAAWKYFSPQKVAKTMENKKLAKAFESKDAIEINQTQRCGGYEITLLGIVSGKDITDMNCEIDGKIARNRSYFMIAIKKVDKNAKDYETIFASPYFEKYNPSLYNLAAMGGCQSGVKIDGVNYVLAECHNIQLFAKHTIYFGVLDQPLYNYEESNKGYFYNEKTGKMRRNEKYQGINALFTLQLDPSLGDEKKAEEYIKKISLGDEKEKDTQAKEKETKDIEFEDIKTWKDLRVWKNTKLHADNILQYATPLEKSKYTVKPDKDGMIYVSADKKVKERKSATASYEALFPNQKSGMSEDFGLCGDDEGIYLKTFTLEKDGTVTYLVYRFNQWKTAEELKN